MHQKLMQSALASVVCALAIGFVPATGSIPTARAAVAQADQWPISVEKEQRGDRVYTHPDGSVSVARCSSGGDPSENRDISTYNASGTRINSVTSVTHLIDFCLPNAIFGKQGEAIGTEAWHNVTNNTYETRVVAFKSGKRIWSVRVPNDCKGKVRQSIVRGMVQDSRGDIYLAAQECSGLLLVGIRRQGTLLFSTKLGYEQTFDNFSQIFAYRDGLVVLQNAYNNSSPTRVRHFTFAGKEILGRRYSYKLQVSERLVEWTVNYDGTAFFAIQKHSPPEAPCIARGISRVVARTLTTTAQHNIHSHCMSLEFGLQQMLSTPNGGVVLANSHSLGSTDITATPLLLITRSGAQVKLEFPKSGGETWLSPSAYIRVGLNGSIMAMRELRATGKRPFYFNEWSLFSADGTLRAVYSSRNHFDSSKSGDAFITPRYAWSVGNGYLYAPMCQKEVPYWCPTGTNKLYRIRFQEASYDYMRGKFDGTPMPKPPINLVVLGDSFSSGEGVEPFDVGTDTEANKCHRSKHAYAYLLELDPSLNLRLQQFAACSGSVSAHLIVRNGTYNLPPQMHAVQANTNIVIFTIVRWSSHS